MLIRVAQNNGFRVDGRSRFGGENLPTIPRSGGIRGVCGDNAPAHLMLRDDPKQELQIPAKPSVTSVPSPAWWEPKGRHGTRIHVADSIKGLSADHGPWFGPLSKDLAEPKTHSLERPGNFENENGCAGVNRILFWVLEAINVLAVRPENTFENPTLPSDVLMLRQFIALALVRYQRFNA